MKIPERITELFKRADIRLLTLMILAGLFFRFYHLGFRSVWLDSARLAVPSMHFLETGSFSSLFRREPLPSFLVASSFYVFGVNEAAARLPSAVCGVLSIPLAFALGRRAKNKRIGLIFAFLVTFSIFQIGWARQVKGYYMLQFFFLSSLYFLERFSDGKSWKNFLPIPLLTLGIYYTDEPWAPVYMLTIGIWFLAANAKWFKRKILNPRESKLRNWLGFLIFAIFAGTIIYYRKEIGLEIFLRSKRMDVIRRAINLDPDILTLLKTQFSKNLSFLMENPAQLFFLAIPGAELAVWRRKRNLLYVAALLVPFIANLFVYFAGRHLVPMYPLFLLFSAFALDFVFEESRKVLKGRGVGFRGRNFLAVVLIIFIAAYPLGTLTFQPQKKYSIGGTAPTGDYREVHNFVERHWRENDILITMNAPITYFYLNENRYKPFYEIPSMGPGYGVKSRVRTLKQLKHVMENSHGWIIIDGTAVYRIVNQYKAAGVEPPVAKYILENYGVIKGVGDKQVRVTRWPKSMMPKN